jgi:hypothetical protein
MDELFQEFPWARYLPLDARKEFAAELASAGEGERPAVLASWTATAEAYSDPALFRKLTEDRGGDYGEAVPPPL